MNFDPETDRATGVQKARVRDGYRKALQRNNMETAEEIRNADTLAEAQHIARRMRDYDPLHGDPTNATKAKIKTLYDVLREFGHDDLAEEVRLTENLTSQEQRALEAIEEIGAEVDAVTGEVLQEPGDDTEAREDPAEV
jgi:hypothetical protein